MDQLSTNPIGIFDSGVGGLSVYKAIRNTLPGESIVYFADQANVPYGRKSLEDVRELSVAITNFLITVGVKLIVIACNTASAGSLHYLRKEFPDFPFVGMEPAVKPAAEISQSKIIGVLATPATFQGTLYESLLDRFANDISILQDTCPGLVGEIEAGRLESPLTRSILENALIPMKAQGVDTIVLGCTHYAFILPIIANILGNDVQIIDPAPAVARQTRRVLTNLDLLNTDISPGQGSMPGPREIRLITSGEINKLSDVLPLLLGEKLIVENVVWNKNLEVYLSE